VAAEVAVGGDNECRSRQRGPVDQENAGECRGSGEAPRVGEATKTDRPGKTSVPPGSVGFQSQTIASRR
jgi:hypothetical protein